jgi:hypothetical protein
MSVKTLTELDQIHNLRGGRANVDVGRAKAGTPLPSVLHKIGVTMPYDLLLASFAGCFKPSVSTIDQLAARAVAERL